MFLKISIIIIPIIIALYIYFDIKRVNKYIKKNSDMKYQVDRESLNSILDMNERNKGVRKPEEDFIKTGDFILEKTNFLEYNKNFTKKVEHEYV